ncbi:MAG: Tfp pilus tip-associated adhesin PilY1 [Saprospiraceae bacterium]|jgi:Tfp pilus tip-associated adhesin PilY1
MKNSSDKQPIRFKFFVVPLIALCVSSTAFAKPLQTPLGFSYSVEPNVMIMLDNSNSMARNKDLTASKDNAGNGNNNDFKNPYYPSSAGAESLMDSATSAIKTVLEQVTDVRFCLSLYDNHIHPDDYPPATAYQQGSDPRDNVGDRDAFRNKRRGGAYMTENMQCQSRTYEKNGTVQDHVANLNDELDKIVVRTSATTTNDKSSRHNSATFYNIAEVRATTSTPLAASYFDMIRYFEGKELVFGQDQSETYDSPIQYRCQDNAIIVVTDGQPYRDWTRNNKVVNVANGATTPEVQAIITELLTYDKPASGGNPSKSLVTNGKGNWDEGDDDNSGKYILDDLAAFGWDIDLKTSGNDLSGSSYQDADFTIQNLTTHTVGFTVTGAFLKDASDKGNGTYSAADNEAELVKALLNATTATTQTSYAVGAGGAQTSVILELDGTTNVIVSSFDTTNWTGDLDKIELKENVITHALEGTHKWSAADALDLRGPSTRLIFTQETTLNPTAGTVTQTTYNFTDDSIKLSNGLRKKIVDYPTQAEYEISEFDRFEGDFAIAHPFIEGDPLSAYAGVLADYEAALQLEWDTTEKALVITAWVIIKADALKEAEHVVEYIRGEKTYEKSSLTDTDTTKKYRFRESRLGDLINSRTTFIEDKTYGYLDFPGTGDKYSDYLAGIDGSPVVARRAMAYVGGNDGMLHAFDASSGTTGGSEVFAYVPNSILGELDRLTLPEYADGHHYFVDGKMTTLDAKMGDDWTTVLASSLGAAGKGLFLLNVEDPIPDLSVTTFSATLRDSLFEWEIHDETVEYEAAGAGFTATTPFSKMGFILNSPKIGRVKVPVATAVSASGFIDKWYLFVGNGVHSQDATDGIIGKASLFIIDLETGKLAKEIVLDDGLIGGGLSSYSTLSDGNGATSVTGIDANEDTYLDRLYVADLKGNIWRINIEDGEFVSARGTTFTPEPIFTATGYVRATEGDGITQSGAQVAQAITSELSVIKAPSDTGSTDGEMLFFGTGQLFDLSHNSGDENRKIQTMYAVWDKGNWSNTPSAISRSDLEQQTTARVTSTTPYTRSISNNSVTYTSKLGWYIDLPEYGEKILRKANIVFDTVNFATRSPEAKNSLDPCVVGTTNWLMTTTTANGTQVKIGDASSSGAGSSDGIGGAGAGLVATPGGTFSDSGQEIVDPVFVKLSDGTVVVPSIDASNKNAIQVTDTITPIKPVFSRGAVKQIQ